MTKHSKLLSLAQASVSSRLYRYVVCCCPSLRVGDD